MNRPEKGRTGHTLIELVLIVFILSFLGAAAAPSITDGLNRHRLNGFARIIMEDLRFAQLEASSHWMRCRLHFNNDSRMLTINQGPKLVKSDPYPVGVRLDHTTYPGNEVSFNEHGDPSSGGSLYIASGNLTYTITVLPVTGRTKLYEYERH